jgi:hypothetical protein
MGAKHVDLCRPYYPIACFEGDGTESDTHLRTIYSDFALMLSLTSIREETRTSEADLCRVRDFIVPPPFFSGATGKRRSSSITASSGTSRKKQKRTHGIDERRKAKFCGTTEGCIFRSDDVALCPKKYAAHTVCLDSDVGRVVCTEVQRRIQTAREQWRHLTVRRIGYIKNYYPYAFSRDNVIARQSAEAFIVFVHSPTETYFCENVRREHRSAGIYFVVTRAPGIQARCMQRCLCRCKGDPSVLRPCSIFRGTHFSMPSGVVRALFPSTCTEPNITGIRTLLAPPSGAKTSPVPVTDIRSRFTSRPFPCNREAVEEIHTDMEGVFRIDPLFQ